MSPTCAAMPALGCWSMPVLSELWLVTEKHLCLMKISRLQKRCLLNLVSKLSMNEDPENHKWSKSWRRECEARDWIRRWKEKAKEIGPVRANKWWNETIIQIENIRGKAAADLLRSDMNKERNATSSKN